MWLSPQDVADELGVSRSLVAAWLRTGFIKAQRDRRGWAWILPEEVERIRRARKRRRRKRLHPSFAEENRP
jgi:predicted site-specific integrase-resolvase